jgi:predicted membrane-bound spermidine synthase
VDRQDGSERWYLNDYLVQNTYDPAAKKSMSEFTYMLAALARAYSTNIQDVLCIGLGVGIVPMDFVNQGQSVDVVEINPAVVPVGVKFFDLDTNKTHITIDDGRHFLNRCQKKFDVVVLDAFLGDSSPSHLFTEEAFGSIRNVLKPGGVLVINAFASLEPGRDFFAASLHKTISKVFPAVKIHGGAGQLYFAASDRPSLEIIHQPDFTTVHPIKAEDVKQNFETMVDTDPNHGIVLRDNHNPAEFYDARNREVLRRQLALDARTL